MTATLNPAEYPYFDERKRLELTALEIVTGVGAVVGGIGAATGWLHLSKARLDGSHFGSYVIPGLILVLAVGIPLLFAAWRVWTRGKYALEISLGAGFMLLGWFGMQIMLIGLFSWIQPIAGATGAVIAVVAVAASRR